MLGRYHPTKEQDEWRTREGDFCRQRKDKAAGRHSFSGAPKCLIIDKLRLSLLRMTLPNEPKP